MTSLTSRAWALFALLLLPASIACSSSEDPEVKSWFTTSDPLPTAMGEFQLEEKGRRVFVIVEAQFRSKEVWTKAAGSSKDSYETKKGDCHLITADGRSIPCGMIQIGKYWVEPGESWTEDPARSSRWTLGFCAEASEVDAGGLKIRFRDLPPMELPPAKRHFDKSR